jgi:hypothetical protein
MQLEVFFNPGIKKTVQNSRSRYSICFGWCEFHVYNRHTPFEAARNNPKNGANQKENILLDDHSRAVRIGFWQEEDHFHEQLRLLEHKNTNPRCIYLMQFLTVTHEFSLETYLDQPNQYRWYGFTGR